MWRFTLPEVVYGKLSNNNLELIINCTTVDVALILHTDSLPPFLCILTLLNNTSTIGPLRSSKTKAAASIKYHLYFTPPHYTSIFLDHNAYLISQHLKGNRNLLTNSLSCNSHLTTAFLASLYLTTFPTQVYDSSTFDLSQDITFSMLNVHFSSERIAQSVSCSGPTQQKEARWWIRLKMYLLLLGFHNNPFLDTSDAVSCEHVGLCLAAHSILCLSLSDSNQFMIGSIKTDISNVSKPFANYCCQNHPFHNPLTRP